MYITDNNISVSAGTYRLSFVVLETLDSSLASVATEPSNLMTVSSEEYILYNPQSKTVTDHDCLASGTPSVYLRSVQMTHSPCSADTQQGQYAQYSD